MSAKAGVQRDWQNKLTGCAYEFAGINNILDPTNIDIESGQVVDGVNVNFDNSNSAVRRIGYTLDTAGSFHSAWNDEQKQFAYMVADSWIYEFDGTDVYPIIQLSNNSHCEFCQVNNVIAYSNGTDFGVIGGSSQQTRTYSPDFKSSTKGGRCLEFYNGRLYFARENSLYCTDTYDIEHVDVRFTRVATFQHAITMCKRVEDGLWVGTEKFVYFLKGHDIREGGFEVLTMAKAGVVYGSACKTNAEYVPEAKSTGNIVVFLTTQGIATGGNTGSYMNHSFNTVSFDVTNIGTSTIMNFNGSSQYLVTFDMDSQYEYSPFQTNISVDVNTL